MAGRVLCGILGHKKYGPTRVWTRSDGQKYYWVFRCLRRDCTFLEYAYREES